MARNTQIQIVWYMPDHSRWCIPFVHTEPNFSSDAPEATEKSREQKKKYIWTQLFWWIRLRCEGQTGGPREWLGRRGDMHRISALAIFLEEMSKENGNNQNDGTVCIYFSTNRQPVWQLDQHNVPYDFSRNITRSWFVMDWGWYKYGYHGGYPFEFHNPQLSCDATDGSNFFSRSFEKYCQRNK